MIYALWFFGVTAAAGWLIAGVAGAQALNTDDFGAGLLTIAALAIGITASLIGLVLAAFHWWPA